MKLTDPKAESALKRGGILRRIDYETADGHISYTVAFLSPLFDGRCDDDSDVRIVRLFDDETDDYGKQITRKNFRDNYDFYGKLYEPLMTFGDLKADDWEIWTVKKKD